MGGSKDTKGRVGRVDNVNVRAEGGVPKLPVPGAHVTTDGVVGDRQRNLRVHGGPMRAVCLFSAEAIEALRHEGHPITAGAAGENLTLSGLDWPRIVPGELLAIGDDVVLEITRYTVPCSNLLGLFAGGNVTRISQDLHPGWSRLYARVLHEGEVRVGDVVRWERGAAEVAAASGERHVPPLES